VEEVARTLDNPDPRELERELTELQLLAYCRHALRRRLPRRT
jgi:hypothetical protein